MAKKKALSKDISVETDFPNDLEEVGKMIIKIVQSDEDEMETVFQVHNILKRVYKKGRARGERDATPKHLQK